MEETELHKFERWLRESCFQKPTPEAHDLAMSAWEAALKEVVKPCPFCGKAPNQYTIGERLSHSEKGQKMVRCTNSSCAIWEVPVVFDQWNERAL